MSCNSNQPMITKVCNKSKRQQTQLKLVMPHYVAPSQYCFEMGNRICNDQRFKVSPMDSIISLVSYVTFEHLLLLVRTIICLLKSLYWSVLPYFKDSKCLKEQDLSSEIIYKATVVVIGQDKVCNAIMHCLFWHNLSKAIQQMMERSEIFENDIFVSILIDMPSLVD